MSESPWVQGAYTPVETEVDAYDLPVTGSIPSVLSGMLTRIGPNPMAPHKPDHNLFFGEGMVHALTLENGKAKVYRNRWVRTPPVSQKLGEMPCAAAIAGDDLANTHIIPFAGKLYALTETCVPYRLNAALETEARDDFGGFITSGFTAHPHVDNTTGHLHALGYALNAHPVATHYVFNADGSPLRRTDIPLGGSSWIHDFAMTQTHMIIWDLPLQFVQALADAGDINPYKWQRDYPARVGLRKLNSADASVTWFDISAGWVFHPVNAWEECDASGAVVSVTCDVARFPKMFDKVRTGPGDMAPPQLYRWHFDCKTNVLREELIDPRIQEYPRIDDRFWGRKNSFSVTTELMRMSGGSGLIVYDGAKDPVDYGFGAGNVSSEGIFVPENDAAGEGEGYILSFVTNAKSGASKAAIFEADSLAKGPVAEIEFPQRVPSTFHGSWIAQVA
jgi:carotenoid cleavage dioxygenase-like enzyme